MSTFLFRCAKQCPLYRVQIFHPKGLARTSPSFAHSMATDMHEVCHLFGAKSQLYSAYILNLFHAKCVISDIPSSRTLSKLHQPLPSQTRCQLTWECIQLAICHNNDSTPANYKLTSQPDSQTGQGQANYPS
jgi:hypothetical protein